jgi:hypothetical protein
MHPLFNTTRRAIQRNNSAQQVLYRYFILAIFNKYDYKSLNNYASNLIEQLVPVRSIHVEGRSN